METPIKIQLYKSGQNGAQPTFLGSVLLTVNDLESARSEAWREQMLMKGRLEYLPDEPLEIRLIEGGYALFLSCFEEPCRFSTKSLEFVAKRLMSELVNKQLIQPDDVYTFRLVDAKNATNRRFDADLWSGMTIAVQKPELVLLGGSLNHLVRQSRIVEIPKGFITAQKNPFMVFYTEAAYAKAELFSRKGSVENPLFESGCILLGYLGYSGGHGLFVVITEAHEVRDAEQTLVSLAYAGTDWQRIMKIVEVRQKKEPHFRILGQSHGHNFLPNNGECCEACPTREYCDITNLFTSPADVEWHRATFQHSPWAVCHIHGRSARGDKLEGLYTLHDGQLSLRDFRVIPEFDPSKFKTITIDKCISNY